MAAGEWEPPAIVGLCEIENRKVLQDLLIRTYLSKYDYSIIQNDSPDPRGIDVCLIYRKDIVMISGYRYLIPARPAGFDFSTRSVLMAKCIIGNEIVHLFVNHWPSRRGGVLAAEDQRKEIAGMVKQYADSVAAAESGNAKIIIAGDFNATPGDLVMSILTGGNGREDILINLSAKADREQGTYRYMGMWQMIDQVIVSRPLLDSETGLYTDKRMFRIFKPGFLLVKDPKYPGLSPLPTYRGYRYVGGFSDHLPVLLDLGIRSAVPKE
jgi:predicted extracellular nuclease